MNKKDKIEDIKKRYVEYGVSEKTVDYAVREVLDGTRRRFIVKGLMVEHRGMQEGAAKKIVEDLYNVTGNEFKKDNINGFIKGILFLAIGIGCSGYIYYFYSTIGYIRRPILFFSGAILGTLGGIIFILMALLGKHKENED